VLSKKVLSIVYLLVLNKFNLDPDPGASIHSLAKLPETPYGSPTRPVHHREGSPHSVDAFSDREGYKTMNKKFLIISVLAGVVILLSYRPLQGFFQTYQEDTWIRQSRKIMEENERKKKDWLVYANEQYNFQIKYPPTWFITDQSNDTTLIVTIASVAEDKYIPQILIPPKGEQWVTIEKKDCPTEDSHGFQTTGTRPELLEQVWCLTGFRFTFSLYADDPDKNKAQETLNLIANSFASYKNSN